MLARKINTTWVLWDGQPFQHPQHPEWGPEWKPTGLEGWPDEALLAAGLTNVIEVRPIFNPTTEVLDGPVESQNATSMTLTWTKRLKSAGEVDAEKTAAVAVMNGPRNAQWEILLLIVNDLRAIKSKINAVIAATGATTALFPAGQTTPIADIAALKTAVKNMLS